MIKYEKYKPSDIDWLGEIPQNWELKRVKDIINKIGSGVTPKGGSEVYVDFGIPLIRSQNVYDDGLRLDDVSFIDEETNNKMKSSQLKPNDILINITGASIGRSCVVPKNIEIANINQHIIYLRVKEKYVPFITYYIKSNVVKEYINLIQAGTSKEALNMGQAINIPVVIPDFNTQNAIVSFIENKTQAIDKKINLLNLKTNYYKEYRKSIINESVTKGLDKNVIFKNSDINYINDIPKHWKIERIKDLFNIGRGRVIGQELLVEEGKYPVYSSQTENNGCLGYIETYDFDNDLLTWTTDGANAGTVFRRSGKFNCTNVCGTLIPKRRNLDLDYVVYALQESATHNKRIDTNGAKIMNNEMAVINIAFPPLKEQTEIAKYLDAKTQTIDKIVENINTQIITLKELRKTLINDVVTGKIKVTQD
ncbi:restriction modification system DNA specificity domain-containing protein [Flavobacterium columnare ATCC 49512]|uniref:Restriction modification system DNA specificity domain-containing protein n=1 Tax=Flavobacterium columnare (strain ATCC 49512 / CIP 103533 / TG 44/87) TaxID=1041826 RepID=G8X4E4_FLACA|nr:restriction endonuclease subunit S [Flavobacterium columnare]AEW85369.1 restriction modification system DNA specificity domain-containing protein [Flavobacterium columnare ATCC 49512]